MIMAAFSICSAHAVEGVLVYSGELERLAVVIR